MCQKGLRRLPIFFFVVDYIGRNTPMALLGWREAELKNFSWLLLFELYFKFVLCFNNLLNRSHGICVERPLRQGRLSPNWVEELGKKDSFFQQTLFIRILYFKLFHSIWHFYLFKTSFLLRKTNYSCDYSDYSSIKGLNYSLLLDNKWYEIKNIGSKFQEKVISLVTLPF